MIHSFNHKGSPCDNACIESFHAILKKEEVNHVQYIDYHAAKIAMFKFIEGWYNRKRIHGRLDYKTPQEVENELLNNIAINVHTNNQRSALLGVCGHDSLLGKPVSFICAGFQA